MTFDRGSEFAQVHHLENRFNLLNYFCDAYCSWQKGSVENQNKEVRVYIRKGTCLLYTSPSPRDATLSRMPSSA